MKLLNEYNSSSSSGINLHVPPINKKKSYFVQPYALHGYKSLYAHLDLEYITYCMVYNMASC